MWFGVGDVNTNNLPFFQTTKYFRPEAASRGLEANLHYHKGKKVQTYILENKGKQLL